jgi:hypothetical protein
VNPPERRTASRRKSPVYWLHLFFAFLGISGPQLGGSEVSTLYSSREIEMRTKK